MSKAQFYSHNHTDRKFTEQQRKDWWDKFWTILFISLGSVFVIYRIVTLISHHQ